MAGDDTAPIRDLPGFILELTLSLRRRGVIVPPADAALAAKLIEAEKFSTAELANVLRAMLVRKPADAKIFAAEFEQLVKKVTQVSQSDAGEKKPKDKEVSSVEPLRRPSSPGWLHRAWKVASRVAVELWEKLEQRAVTVHFVWWLASIAAGLLILIFYAFYWTCLGSCPPPQLCLDGEFCQQWMRSPSLFSVVLAAILSIFTIPIVYVVRRWTLRGNPELPGALEIIEGSAKSAPSANDETSFRVGVLGGAPPVFLNPVLATQIVEIISYRDAGEDVRRIDLRKTIDRMVRGGDSAMLYAARRRELPQIILVTDQASPARFFNTLAEEFASILLARGIVHERMSYAASFHGHDGRLKPAHRELNQLLDGLGWQVLCLFGEFHGLSDLDQRLLSRLAEQGPVLFLDYRDPLLWDVRHRRFSALHANILLEPATGQGLLTGLERIFVPGADRSTHQHPPLDAAVLKDWIQECALVEPMSFALAEMLRQRHAANHPTLSFPLAAAQPGSWVGPEGLRFAPLQRYRLLDAFAQRPEKDRQKVLDIINGAFSNAPVPLGETAKAIKDYAQAQANVLAPDADEEAIGTIVRAEEAGHVDPLVVGDFRGRLRLPSTTSEPGTIRLPGVPQRAEYRALLSQHIAPQDMQTQEINAARWGIGMPQVRVEMRTYATEGTAGPRVTPIAIFIPGVQMLLTAVVDVERAPELHLLQINHGIQSRIETPRNFGRVAGLWAARDAPVIVLACENRRLFRLSGEDGDSDASQLRLEDMEFEVPGGEAVSLALDWTGELICCNSPAGLVLIERGKGQRGLKPRRSDGVTAIGWLPDSELLLGFETGEIHRALLGGSSEGLNSDHLFTVKGRPIGFAVIGEKGALTAIAVSTASGQVELHVAMSTEKREGYLPDSGHRFALAGTYQFPSAVQRIMLLPNSPAVRIRRNGGAEDNGFCLAVLGADGRFEVLGFPAMSPAVSTTSHMLRPMALTARHPLTHGAMASTIAFSVASRRVAGWRDSRLEVRPLLYERPAPFEDEDRGEASQAAENEPAEPAIKRSQQESSNALPA